MTIQLNNTELNAVLKSSYQKDPSCLNCFGCMAKSDPYTQYIANYSLRGNPNDCCNNPLSNTIGGTCSLVSRVACCQALNQPGGNDSTTMRCARFAALPVIAALGHLSFPFTGTCLTLEACRAGAQANRVQDQLAPKGPPAQQVMLMDGDAPLNLNGPYINDYGSYPHHHHRQAPGLEKMEHAVGRAIHQQIRVEGHMLEAATRTAQAGGHALANTASSAAEGCCDGCSFVAKNIGDCQCGECVGDCCKISCEVLGCCCQILAACN